MGAEQVRSEVERGGQGYTAPTSQETQSQDINSANFYVLGAAATSYKAMLAIQEAKLEMMVQMGLTNQNVAEATGNAALANATATSNALLDDASSAMNQSYQSFSGAGGTILGTCAGAIGGGKLKQANEGLGNITNLQTEAETIQRSPTLVGPNGTQDEAMTTLKQKIMDGRIDLTKPGALDEKLPGETYTVREALSHATDQTESDAMLKQIAKDKKTALKQVLSLQNERSSRQQMWQGAGNMLSQGTQGALQINNSTILTDKAKQSAENVRTQQDTSFAQNIGRAIQADQEQYAKEADDALSSIQGLIALNRPA